MTLGTAKVNHQKAIFWGPDAVIRIRYYGAIEGEKKLTCKLKSYKFDPDGEQKVSRKKDPTAKVI